LSYLVFKRTIDLFFSIIFSVFALPVIVILALISLIRFQKNPFITQLRSLSLSRKPFITIKIRTIRSEEGFNEEEIRIKNFLDKQNLKRFVPSFFIYIRRTGLDELPQLLNVIKGEMSLIGPRPFTLNDLESMKINYLEYYRNRIQLNCKPGISGYWQIYGNKKNGFKELVEMDWEYQNKCSLLFDLKLILLTFKLALFAQNRDSIAG
jgi:lipopolysaccharide/colanic/teichoic acid biosynthesis glycosyltransferase